MKSRIGSAMLVVLVGVGLMVAVNGCGGSGSSSGIDSERIDGGNYR
jgi:hypothetical protein